jgi:DNA polymerase-3 subunit alpha (Gram-positive type)
MGVEKKAAFKIMENVRKGKGLTCDEIEKMLDAGIPEWYIDSCNRIKYLFPKGHAVAYVMMTVRIGYYKVYYPYSFYAASFSVKAEDFDLEMCKGRENLLSSMRELSGQKDLSAKDKNKLSIMELVNEMYARGLKFSPLDIYKAKMDEFLVTPQGLMPPLCAVQGLGASVAQNIVDARNEGNFFTVDDFRERTKTNKTVVELLRKNGVLKGIPETNQMTLDW